MSKQSSRKEDPADRTAIESRLGPAQKKNKGDKSNQPILYDKVRYPGYKDLIYRKKDQILLP